MAGDATPGGPVHEGDGGGGGAPGSRPPDHDRTGGRGASGLPAHAGDARPGDELLARSLALVRFLRRECPWDARQTPESLRPYLLEEAHETADAILEGDDRALAGELGDLLLNVAFQIVVAEERGAFGAGDVVRRLEAKMEARHPHVYGDAEEPPDWEETKARERAADRAPPDGRTAGGGPPAPGDEPSTGGDRGDPAGVDGVDGQAGDPFQGIPGGLEALSRSLRVQQRAAARGFDWPDVSGAVGKLREEIRELEELLEGAEGRAGGRAAGGVDARAGGTVPGAALEEEVGDLLFAAVNVARLASVHPAGALRRAEGKFRGRYREMVHRARERGLDPREASLEEMEAIWREVKRERARDAGTG